MRPLVDAKVWCVHDVDIICKSRNWYQLMPGLLQAVLYTWTSMSAAHLRDGEQSTSPFCGLASKASSGPGYVAACPADFFISVFFYFMHVCGELSTVGGICQTDSESPVAIASSSLLS